MVEREEFGDFGLGPRRRRSSKQPYEIEGIDEYRLPEPGGQGFSPQKQEFERDSLRDRKQFGFVQGCGGR